MLFPGDPDFQESEARAELTPIHEVLRNIVLDAVDTLMSAGRDYPDLALAYEYMSLRQHALNSLVVVKVQDAVASGTVPDAEITRAHSFLELKTDRIDLRFKQVRRDGSTSNYPTRSNFLYKNQLTLLGDDTKLDRVRLTLGWRWDVAATQIADIVVVYAKGDDTQWMYSILRADEQPMVLTTTKPRVPMVPGVILPQRIAEGQEVRD